jgi:hypothetical protein
MYFLIEVIWALVLVGNGVHGLLGGIKTGTGFNSASFRN